MIQTADNVAITAGTGTTIATDDVGGAHYQRVKVVSGADGTCTDVSAAAPLPVTAVLTAGSAAVGKLAANDGVDIGDVDVTTVVPGVAATSLGKAEDAAHTSGDVGVMALGVRQDTPASLAGTTGDYVPPTFDQSGRQYVDAALDSSALMAAGVALTPKFAIIDAATSGNNTLVAAVNPKKIRVLAAFLVASAAVTARFESGADGTALTGQMQLAANGGFALPFNPAGWFETASNTLLNLELSGAISVDGCLTYVEV